MFRPGRASRAARLGSARLVIIRAQAGLLTDEPSTSRKSSAHMSTSRARADNSEHEQLERANCQTRSGRIGLSVASVCQSCRSLSPVCCSVASASQSSRSVGQSVLIVAPKTQFSSISVPFGHYKIGSHNQCLTSGSYEPSTSSKILTHARACPWLVTLNSTSTSMSRGCCSLEPKLRLPCLARSAH